MSFATYYRLWVGGVFPISEQSPAPSPIIGEGEQAVDFRLSGCMRTHDDSLVPDVWSHSPGELAIRDHYLALFDDEVHFAQVL